MINLELQRYNLLPRYLRPPIEMFDSLLETISAIREGCPIKLEAENVIHQNSLQIVNASRFLYSEKNEFELVEDMIKTNPALKHPVEVICK